MRRLLEPKVLNDSIERCFKVVQFFEVINSNQINRIRIGVGQ
jgi:hypothetical protein